MVAATRFAASDPGPHMFTYENCRALEGIPSTPPALEYLPELRATGIHSLGR